jgi:hypothetical protein
LLLYFALSTTPRKVYPSICAAMWKEKWAVAMAIVYPWSIDLYRDRSRCCYQFHYSLDTLHGWIHPRPITCTTHPSIRPCFLSLFLSVFLAWIGPDLFLFLSGSRVRTTYKKIRKKPFFQSKKGI